MSDKIIVGSIVKLQGIKGEVKIKPYTNDPCNFSRFKSIFIDNTEYKIEKCRVQKNMVYFIFKDLYDRTELEKLNIIGKDIFQYKKLLLPKDSDRYLIADILESKVYSDEKLLGTLKDIYQYGAADVYRIKTIDNKFAMFPLLKKIISKIDIENKEIFLLKQELDKIIIYED